MLSSNPEMSNPMNSGVVKVLKHLFDPYHEGATLARVASNAAFSPTEAWSQQTLEAKLPELAGQRGVVICMGGRSAAAPPQTSVASVAVLGYAEEAYRVVAMPPVVLISDHTLVCGSAK